MSRLPKPPGTIYFYKGLPACGKTTHARDWQLAIGSKHLATICKDDLRAMLHQSEFNKTNEDQVLRIEYAIVLDCLMEGRDVSIHNTHLNTSHEDRYRKLAAQHGYAFEVIDMTDVPVSVCIARDSLRDKPVGEEVIRRLAKGKGIPECKPIPYDNSLNDCYIFDLDGTLALHDGKRSPYDYTRVSEDTPNWPVIVTFNRLGTLGGAVMFIFSGREDSCKQETINWLTENSIRHNEYVLAMRKTGDSRSDAIVKEEMWQAHIEGKYNCLGIFDDRDRVVAMHRAEGRPVYQVNYGNF